MTYRNGITSEIETITPTLAERYLERNDGNRLLSQRYIDAYAADMRDNRWDMNGETVKFAEDGTLLDGQHRMWACIEAGVPFKAVVVRGLARGAQVTMDNGKSRRFHDHLQIKGYASTHRLQGALTALFHIKHGTRNMKLTNSQFEAMLNKHPHIVDAMQACQGIKLSFNWPVLSAVYYLAYYILDDRRNANLAIKTMISGIPQYDGDPMHALRERWINERLRNKAGLASSQQRMGWIWATIAAWNGFREGDQVLQVKLRAKEVRMIGLDYNLI